VVLIGMLLTSPGSKLGIKCHGRCDADPTAPVPVVVDGSAGVSVAPNMVLSVQAQGPAPLQGRELFTSPFTCTDCGRPGELWAPLPM